jgi:hypothetical protein
MLSNLFEKKSNYGISKPSKIFFSPNSIISSQGLISLELDNRFHLYESNGKTLVYDINSKSRVFYGDLKLNSSVDFILDKSYYSFESLVKRNILRKITLLDAFSNLGILDIFISSISSLSSEMVKDYPKLSIMESLRVSGLNVPLKNEFLKILSENHYTLTEYGSKHLYVENNDFNVSSLNTLHFIEVYI